MRTLLLRALLLDWLGQLLILVLIIWINGRIGIVFDVRSIQSQWPWIVFVLMLYPLLGWLFGSYTVLRWRQLTTPVLLQRLLITASVTLVVVAVARWLINPSDEVWLVSRQYSCCGLGLLRRGR